MDLQLSMQSVPITTNVASSNHTQAIQDYVIQFFVNKSDHYDVAEILLKVALNTINLNLLLFIYHGCFTKLSYITLAGHTSFLFLY